jgi:hypothetical protein
VLGHSQKESPACGPDVEVERTVRFGKYRGQVDRLWRLAVKGCQRVNVLVYSNSWHQEIQGAVCF